MATWKVRVKGTINDVVEVDADDEAGALEEAVMQWRYVEYEDLSAVSAYEAQESRPDDEA